MWALKTQGLRCPLTDLLGSIEYGQWTVNDSECMH